MEDGNISDSQINASSEVFSSHLASHARLNHPVFWAALSSNMDQWLQVDFNRVVPLTKVATQGRSLEQGDHYQWVTTYSLRYSHNGAAFKFYKQFGEVKVRCRSLSILLMFFF